MRSRAGHSRGLAFRISLTALHRRHWLVRAASPVNECLELHDSTLSHVTFRDGSVVVSLSSAYIHRSPGRPGWDAGSGGCQPATLTFGEARPVSLPAELPATISDGFLRVGDTTHDNLIPASGTFEREVEFSIILTTAEIFTFRALRVTIQLHGEPACIEQFEP